MKYEIVNATIKNTMLGIEDHGILTFLIHCEGDGWGQGFGGHICNDSAFLSEAIRQILETLEVDNWEDLPRKNVRLKRGKEDDMLHAIGHITKNKWYDIKRHGKKFSGRK
jgi:hypothetical protein